MAEATKPGICPHCLQGHVGWVGVRTPTERTLRCNKCFTETVVTKEE
jgi:hypothetical protein